MTRPDQRYGFPSTVMGLLDYLMPGNATVCGLCGDNILGGRHRVIDAITERLIAGEGEESVSRDYGIAIESLWVIVAASYEHDKALKRQRRAERKAVAS